MQVISFTGKPFHHYGGPQILELFTYSYQECKNSQCFFALLKTHLFKLAFPNYIVIDDIVFIDAYFCHFLFIFIFVQTVKRIWSLRHEKCAIQFHKFLLSRIRREFNTTSIKSCARMKVVFPWKYKWKATHRNHFLGL